MEKRYTTKTYNRNSTKLKYTTNPYNRNSTKLKIVIISLLVFFCSVSVFAEKTMPESNAFAIDMVWTLIAAFLVFFMQAGFAMVETGFTRAKNAGNIIMKNLMDFSVGSLAF